MSQCENCFKVDVCSVKPETYEVSDCKYFLNGYPTAEWVWSSYLKVWKCSHCNFTKPYETRGGEYFSVKDFWYCGYCPNCGSKMLNGEANLTPREDVIEE